MAARVTAAEVKKILDDCTLTDAIINAFIAGATELVTQALGSSSLGANLLKEIERWLTAHLIATTPVGDQRTVTDEGAGGAYTKYAGTFGEGLHSTSYGQTVLALDTTGAMAGLSARKARIVAIESFDD
jgi:hypothetical protein